MLSAILMLSEPYLHVESHNSENPQCPGNSERDFGSDMAITDKEEIKGMGREVSRKEGVLLAEFDDVSDREDSMGKGQGIRGHGNLRNRTSKV